MQTPTTDLLTGCFVTATGTDAGKTVVSLALTAALRHNQRQVCAVKPLETGCQPDAQDAQALAAACDRPDLVHAPLLYRARTPLSPAATAILEDHPVPPLQVLGRQCRNLMRPGDFLLVEGAGGLLVPTHENATIADLAQHLSLPLLLVAPNRLGTLSDTLCTYEAAHKRGLRVAAVVLNDTTRPDDSQPASHPASNHRLLGARLPVPVLALPHLTATDRHSLANAARKAGLLGALRDCAT